MGYGAGNGFCPIAKPDENCAGEQQCANHYKSIAERHDIGVSPYHIFNLGVGSLRGSH
jgi:hypothetical protein